MSPTNCTCGHASISHRIQDGVSLCTGCSCEEYIPEFSVKIPEISEVDAGIFTKNVQELENLKPTAQEMAGIIKNSWKYMFETRKAHEMSERELINFYSEIQYSYQHLSSMVEARGVKITREKISKNKEEVERFKEEKAAAKFAAAKVVKIAKGPVKLSKEQKVAKTLGIDGWEDMSEDRLHLEIRKAML